MRTAAVLFTFGVWVASAQGATHTVNTPGLFFDPADLTIAVGDTVTWNLSGGFHTSTSDTGVWNSGFVATYSWVFDTPGTFPYYCMPHGGPGGVGMSGVIRVTAAKAATETSLESSVNPSQAGEEVTLTATIIVTGGSSMTPSGTVTFTDDGAPLCTNVAMSGASASCSTSTLSAGTHSIVATYSGDASFHGSVSEPLQQTVNDVAPPPAPAILSATAVSTAAVSLMWSPSAGATEYRVYRTQNRLSAYQLVATTDQLSETDMMMVAANTTYLYKVRAFGPGGESLDSPIDAATTVVFTDVDLAGVTVKAVHIHELQTAVSAMRVAAALMAGSFTSIAAGTEIRAVHIDELRAALDEARGAIGLSSPTYTDPTLTAGETTVKAAHAAELRAGTQ